MTCFFRVIFYRYAIPTGLMRKGVFWTIVLEVCNPSGIDEEMCFLGDYARDMQYVGEVGAWMVKCL